MTERDVMTIVFTLYHIYEKPNGEEEIKLIGIYSSMEKANATLQRLKSKPGFVDYPDNFEIFDVKLDRDGWTEGFFSASDA
jgi:hypothetical protein